MKCKKSVNFYWHLKNDLTVLYECYIIILHMQNTNLKSFLLLIFKDCEAKLLPNLPKYTLKSIRRTSFLLLQIFSSRGPSMYKNLLYFPPNSLKNNIPPTEKQVWPLDMCNCHYILLQPIENTRNKNDNIHM